METRLLSNDRLDLCEINKIVLELRITLIAKNFGHLNFGPKDFEHINFEQMLEKVNRKLGLK